MPETRVLHVSAEICTQLPPGPCKTAMFASQRETCAERFLLYSKSFMLSATGSVSPKPPFRICILIADG